VFLATANFFLAVNQMTTKSLDDHFFSNFVLSDRVIKWWFTSLNALTLECWGDRL